MSAPNFSSSSPLTLGGMLATSFTGQNQSSLTNRGVDSTINLLGSLLGLPSMAMAAMTTPATLLGHVSQLATRFGLIGQQTDGSMGLSQCAINAARGICLHVE